MNIGVPVRTVIIKPETLPIPQKEPIEPERREVPQEQPVRVPEHVNECIRMTFPQ